VITHVGMPTVTDIIWHSFTFTFYIYTNIRRSSIIGKKPQEYPNWGKLCFENSEASPTSWRKRWTSLILHFLGPQFEPHGKLCERVLAYFYAPWCCGYALAFTSINFVVFCNVGILRENTEVCSMFWEFN